MLLITSCYVYSTRGAMNSHTTFQKKHRRPSFTTRDDLSCTCFVAYHTLTFSSAASSMLRSSLTPVWRSLVQTCCRDDSHYPWGNSDLLGRSFPTMEPTLSIWENDGKRVNDLSEYGDRYARIDISH